MAKVIYLSCTSSFDSDSLRDMAQLHTHIPHYKAQNRDTGVGRPGRHCMRRQPAIFERRHRQSQESRCGTDNSWLLPTQFTAILSASRAESRTPSSLSVCSLVSSPLPSVPLPLSPLHSRLQPRRSLHTKRPTAVSAPVTLHFTQLDCFRGGVCD